MLNIYREIQGLKRTFKFYNERQKFLSFTINYSDSKGIILSGTVVQQTANG